MESRDDQRRGGGNPAPATTYIILSRSGAGYLGSYMRTSNPMERSIQQEIKRRTVKVRVFPNEASLERLVTAILVEIDEKWETTEKPYITWKAEDD